MMEQREGKRGDFSPGDSIHAEGSTNVEFEQDFSCGTEHFGGYGFWNVVCREEVVTQAAAVQEGVP